MKSCSKCGVSKPLNQFWYDKRKERHVAACKECAALARKSWKNANTDKVKRANREWQLANPQRVKAAMERWKQRNPGVAAQRMREWRESNLERHRETSRRNDKRIKDIVYAKYGGYRCACCGETEPKFLSIDHVNNDGAAHRREIPRLQGKKIYSWLIENGFPKDFQILCMNCNWGKARNNGVCPHKISEGSTTSRKA